jgi:PKD repeat protein
LGIKPGDEVTFKVRSFGVRDPEETWDFGDGTRTVVLHSDGNAKIHDPNGYAVTTHVFAKPGIYIVRVERTNNGYPSMAHLLVTVGDE